MESGRRPGEGPINYRRSPHFYQMKFLIACLTAIVFAQNHGGHGGHHGGDHDTDFPGHNGRPCFPGACSTMECCTDMFKRCHPTIDCNGEIIYVPWGIPTRRR